MVRQCAQTFADWRGFEPPTACSSNTRWPSAIEHEFVDLAAVRHGARDVEPLASGLLSGKYRAGAAAAHRERPAGDARGQSPALRQFTERNFGIVAELEAVASEADRPMAQVALNWLPQKRGVSSVIVGATKPEQLQESLGSLDFTLEPELIARLDAVSEPPARFRITCLPTVIRRESTAGSK